MRDAGRTILHHWSCSWFTLLKKVLGTLWKRLRAPGTWLGGLKLRGTTFDCSLTQALPKPFSLRTRAYATTHFTRTRHSVRFSKIAPNNRPIC